MTVVRKQIAGVLLFAVCFCMHASTIVPFLNLGEVLKNSDIVVYGEVADDLMYQQENFTQQIFGLKTLVNIKGDHHVGDIISIKNYHHFTGDLEAKVWGDLYLEKGKRYLLFLKESNQAGLYTALCMSYYSFEEVEQNGMNYLMPAPESSELHLAKRPDGKVAEPLRAYLKTDLIKYLASITDNPDKWSKDQYRPKSIGIDELTNRAEPPSHCTFVFGSPWSRWTGFPSQQLPVRYRAGGDALCSSGVAYTEAAVTELNSKYLGIKLNNSGAFSDYTPNCVGGSASSGNFTTYVNSNLGGGRNVCVMYNDPCNEIPNLSDCEGILAIGGHYAGGSHSFQGKTWLNASYGFVIINEIGNCYCSDNDYQIVLIHELTHTLGIGHIDSGDGVANMNPTCCNDITQLDIDCLDYTYPSSLPVTLELFTGKLESGKIQLRWKTSAELNNKEYIIEQSADGSTFEKIMTVAAIGTSTAGNTYEEIIEALPGISYIRLGQMDFDGTSSYIGNILSFNNKESNACDVKVYYTSGRIYFILNKNTDYTEQKIDVFNAVGNPVYTDYLPSGDSFSIDASHLPAGIYLVKFANEQVLKFIKEN